MRKAPKILIAPLDWGIGHSTRIIPLIIKLLSLNCEVVVAADGQTRALLEKEFAGITFLQLKGYGVKYARKRKWLPVKILLQVPKILLSIYRENRWLKRAVKKYAIDAVISDNRFGLYHASIPCVYITHQLLIKTGNRFSESWLQKFHYRFIKKYSRCWVPDFEGTKNVAGQLSHPSTGIPPNVTYIGGVSRFERHAPFEIKYDLLVLLSGPEPQRTIFENTLLLQLQQYEGSVLLVRGLPGLKETGMANGNVNKNLLIKNHLTAAALNLVIEQSAMIVCRSGYTTIMDLVKLQKKAILVPTPGQTEQEYLAAHLLQQQRFYTVAQNTFVLSEALENAAHFDFLFIEYNMEQYKKTIHQFIEELNPAAAYAG